MTTLKVKESLDFQTSVFENIEDLFDVLCQHCYPESERLSYQDIQDLLAAKQERASASSSFQAVETDA